MPTGSYDALQCLQDILCAQVENYSGGLTSGKSSCKWHVTSFYIGLIKLWDHALSWSTLARGLAADASHTALPAHPEALCDRGTAWQYFVVD